MRKSPTEFRADVRGRDMGVEEGTGKVIGGRRNENATMDVRSYEAVHEEEPPFRHVRHLPRTESVFEKQGEPHHQFECAVHDRVQKPSRRVSARNIGQTNVPQSRRIRSGGVH